MKMYFYSAIFIEQMPVKTVHKVTDKEQVVEGVQRATFMLEQLQLGHSN